MNRPASKKTSLPSRLRARLSNPVTQFTLAGLAAVAVVGAVSAYLLARAGTDEAIRDAKRLTALAGEGIVQPALSDRFLRGDPAAIRRIDELVRGRILSHDGVARVKIWDADGRIVYSDEPRLIGDRFELGADELAILRHGGTEAETTDLSRPENRYERGAGELLEVYLPIHTPDGTPVLFETYVRSSFVESAGQEVWSTLAPVLIGAFVVLAALQLPLAWSLARRLRRGQEEREALLRRAIDASEIERRGRPGSRGALLLGGGRRTARAGNRDGRRLPAPGRGAHAPERPRPTWAAGRDLSTRPAPGRARGRPLGCRRRPRRSSSESPRRRFATWSHTPVRTGSRCESTEARPWPG